MFSINKILATLSLLIFLLVSCGHLPDDPHPNPAASGYHRMEFDINDGTTIKKEIGIGNIILSEDQDINNISFKFYGIYKGTIYLKSDACGVNFAVPFDGELTFNLKDLIPYPIKCSIKLTADTSKIEGYQHVIAETGEIKINVIPTDHLPLSFEYTRANSTKRAFYKTYAFVGQASMQRQEGDLTYQEVFTVKTGLTLGGSYRISGCNLDLSSTTNESADKTGDVISYSGTFDKSDFVIKFKDLYKKDYLKNEDTCDLEIMVIPNEITQTMEGRFSFNVYDKNAVVLENLDYTLSKHWYDSKYDLVVSGQDYIAACSINEVYKISKTCKVSPYDPNTTYWIKAITTNGRKSVYSIKNGQIDWKE